MAPHHLAYSTIAEPSPAGDSRWSVAGLAIAGTLLVTAALASGVVKEQQTALYAPTVRRSSLQAATLPRAHVGDLSRPMQPMHTAFAAVDETVEAEMASGLPQAPTSAMPAGLVALAVLFGAAALAVLRLAWAPAGARAPAQPEYFAMAATASSAAADFKVDALIVGSGISGSCTAHNIFKNQKITNVLLTERNPTVGGNVISRTDGEFTWEEGPNSFQPTPAIMRTTYELGLTDELVLADASLPRFVYWKGGGAGEKLANLHALPTNLPGDLLDFNLLTIPGKLRAGFGALGFISPPPPEPYEESIREFVTRHLGEETFLRVIDPFVSGVYAGDPDQLAMRAALKKIHRLEGLGDFGPGLVSGAINRFKELAAEKRENPADPAWPTYKGGQLGSFRKGLQTLPNAVAKELGPERVKTSWELTSLSHDGAYFLATYDTPEGVKTVQAKTVAVTAPTRVTYKVCADLVPAAAQLEKVYSPPVASVTMAYRKEWFKELPGAQPGKPLVGFGHLLPRSMGVRSLGTIWSSSLFPGRAPEGWELLLTYIGGARDKAIGDMSEEDIVKQVDADNHQILLKPDAPAGKLLGCRVWKQAIPQYCRGHLDILAALERDEAKVPGLFIGGNYRTGVAFGDCVQYGLEEAGRMGAFLAKAK